MSTPARRRWTRWWGVVPIVLVIGLFALRAGLHVDPRARLRPVPAAPADPPGARAGSGSLAVVRGGPLIIGFQSDGPAQLTVGGRTLVGRGLVRERIVVPAGALAIRFAAAPDARLVWSPVGRRGDPEYVPTSSVSPDDPSHARFDAPGAAVTDGVIALALLLTLVATLLMLARHRLAGVPRSTWLAMGAVLALALIARWIDLGGFGQTWDEDVNWAAGRNYVTNVLALDFSARAWTWNYEHPPVMKLLAGIGAQLADGFGPARALSAVWISLGAALLVPIGRRLFSLRVGVLAAAIAALLPSLVAHGQVVGHESPTVLWWSLGILLAVCAHDGLPEAPRAARRALLIRLAVIGVVVGIAVASRFVNGLLGPLCVIIVVVQAPATARRLTLLGAPLMALASVITFWAVWPRLWLTPVASLQASLRKLDNPHGLEPFLGTITNVPPSYYFVVYLVAVLPVGVLALAGVGLVRTAVERTRATWIALAWLVVPLVVAVSPVRQDGVRYVMPCLTALALIAALGVDAIATRLATRVRHAFTALAGVLLVYLAITLVRVHPYYLDYFGEHVGGAAGVSRRNLLETAWWGEGLDRAVAHVNAHAAPNARVFRDCIEPSHLAWFREDLWTRLARTPMEADWIVVYAPARRRCGLPPDARKVFAVTAGGLVLAEVYQRP